MSIESTLNKRVSTASDTSPEKDFIARRLPWVLGGGALLVYLLTLNHWGSFRSIENVGLVSGWNWQPELTRPLYWLLTFPFRFLPVSMIPIALNLFSALCGALALVLLARSAALLPFDRTEEERRRERSPFSLLSIRAAWVPPVAAVLVCGLQLSFWEQSTAASSDILDLLLFAYVVRCLLEFRTQAADSWLLRAAFVYGLSMTNNWAMVAFFPVFLAALIWMKGRGFFELPFLRQMFFIGSAGLSLYLVLPAVAMASVPELGFWQALKLNLGTQKSYLFYFFNKPALFQSDRPLWVVGLYSLLPVLAIAIRIPRFAGDTSKAGVMLSRVIFQVLKGALFVLCLWVALDPQFSPRNYVGLNALPLYFLAALSVGYFAGYFLLVFGGATPTIRGRPMPGYHPLINFTVTAAVWVLLAVTTVLLLDRNLPQIRLTNGPLLHQYARLMADKIPPGPSVVLSDDVPRLFFLRSVWAEKHVQPDAVLLETHALASPIYHRFLHRSYPKRWQSPGNRKEQFENYELQQLIVGLAASNSVYYLHPSFGYYFEEFYAEPHGVVYRLGLYPTNSIERPPLSAGLIAENQEFWQTLDHAAFDQLIRASSAAAGRGGLAFLDGLAERAHLRKIQNFDAMVMALFYSRALDFWSVDLQRDGKLDEAETWFNRAKDLNPNNLAAEINLASNHRLKTGEKFMPDLAKAYGQKLGQFRSIQDILNANGPVDDPSLCFELGRDLFQGNNLRQAAQEFQRVALMAPENAPENLRARLLYANATLRRGAVDESLHAIEEIEAQRDTLSVSRTNAQELLTLHALALIRKGNRDQAEELVRTTLKRYPDDEDLLATATDFYLNVGLYTNALHTTSQQIKLRPENTSALVNQGLAWIRLGDFTNAIAPLDRAVGLGPSASAETNIYYAALFNRGLAYWKSEQLEPARKDFEGLQKVLPTNLQVSYVLGEINYAEKNTNTAIRNYQLFLSLSPSTNDPATSNALVRLKELKPTGK